MRPLYLAILIAAGCATQLPSVSPLDDMASGSADLAGTFSLPDMTDTTSFFIGTFTWDSQTAKKQTVCDNGMTVDPSPSGNFPVTPGPGAGQVNIGVGTPSCPIFIFNVGGDGATLANGGTTCQSGPGTVSPSTGSLTTSDGGQTLTVALTINLSIPRGDGTTNHCVVSVMGTALRK